VTPVPLDLPLRPPEAAEVANLVFSLAERKPLNDEVRGRVASRLAAMRTESLRAYAGSLDRDPVHHSTYYMAVDGQNGEPLLLHMAAAAAPTSAIFAKPLLIGRMRRAGGPEMVLNAIPFGPGDHESIERFAAQIDPAFLPRAQASRPALVASATPAAFASFRAIWKAKRKNYASVAAAPGEAPAAFYYAAVWAAIRAGWREGYTAGITITIESADLDDVRGTICEAASLTRFAIDVSRLVNPHGAKYEEALKAAERAHEMIRQARAARKIGRPFDFELSLENAPASTTAEELAFCLDWLKSHGHAAQLMAPRVGPGSDLASLAEAARSSQCTLSVDSRAGDLAAIGRATAGRVNFRLGDLGAEDAAGELFG
jgi:hypothetical protein